MVFFFRSQEATDYSQYWQYYQNWSQYAAWNQYSQHYQQGYGAPGPTGYETGYEGQAGSTTADEYNQHAYSEYKDPNDDMLLGDKPNIFEGDEFELVGE